MWWALGSAPRDIATPAAPESLFEVRLKIAGPVAAPGVERLKTIFDGVVCALQAYVDAASARTASERLSGELGVSIDEIAARLLSTEVAILGTVSDLRRATAAWNPSDHLCVAGGIAFQHASSWTVRGEVLSCQPC